MFIIINLVAWYLAAICKACMDTLQFHYDISIFSRKGHKTIDHEYFWNPAISWRNKYKGRLPEKGEKFLGSTTIFVWTTDAWHMIQMVYLTMISLTVVTMPFALDQKDFTSLVIMFLGYRISFLVVFDVFYRFILKR